MSRALQISIERWKTLAEGVGKQAGEVQRALTQVRAQHSNLCAEQEKIRLMKQGYFEQLKEAEHSQDDLQQSTQLRRFMGQLDLTTRAITDQMADLQRQQRTIAARLRELNSERIKFETLADRARTQLKQTAQKKEQKDSDALNAQRFAIKTNQRPSS